MNRSAGLGAVAQAASMAELRRRKDFFMRVARGPVWFWRSDTPALAERQYEIIEIQ
jgi:hypothetical protein